MLFSVEQAFLGRDKIRAPLKTLAWEASVAVREGRCSAVQSETVKIKFNYLPAIEDPVPPNPTLDLFSMQ